MSQNSHGEKCTPYLLRSLNNTHGVAMITTILILAIMTLSALALSHFSTVDMRISGNDAASRMLLYKVEAVGAYAAQTFLALGADSLALGNPERPGWVHGEEEARVRDGFDLADGKNFNALSEKDLAAFVQTWTGASDDLMYFSDEKVSFFAGTSKISKPFPLIGEGATARVMVVHQGPSDLGSQDMGEAALNDYTLFSEYEDARGHVQFLELGIRRRH